MEKSLRSRLLSLGVIVVLVMANVTVFGLLFSPSTRTHGLRVSVLDVGQGDSILIQGPTGIDVLIDGGPDRSVLRELPKSMGPLDRSIDMVIETHPDKDHIAGLTDVFENYTVQNFMSPNVTNDTDVYKRVVHAVAVEPGLHVLVAQKGMRLHLGNGAYADVLYPDHDVSTLRVTNDASIALRVVYGDTAFMFTGDLPSTIEDQLVAVEGNNLRSDVLKAGHHGSKYSTDDRWLAIVNPSIVVISAGKENTYGHPAPETLARIENAGATIVSTIERGTIVFESDGARVTQK